jgi:hypothetical protein
MDCHSCSRLADLLEAHGRRHSGREAEVSLATVVVSLPAAVQRMRSRAIALRVAGMEEDTVEAVVAESVIAELVVDIARAREPAWAQVLRKTC